jgi:hypothetical protein
MKAYLITTGLLSGLLFGLHVWRFIEEGSHLFQEPSFLVSSVISAVVFLWSWRLFRRPARP